LQMASTSAWDGDGLLSDARAYAARYLVDMMMTGWGKTSEEREIG
jgi:hypothetical protein